MAGVEQFIDLPVELAAAPKEHCEPDCGERDERAREANIGSPIADR